MPPTRKTTGGEETFIWTDDEVELLLNIAIDYKAQKLVQGVSWESVQSKYNDIAERLAQHLSSYQQSNPDAIDKDYPHDSIEITREKVSTKLKAIRSKYRSAVDTGRRSGQGRVVLLYFDQCESI